MVVKRPPSGPIGRGVRAERLSGTATQAKRGGCSMRMASRVAALAAAVAVALAGAAAAPAITHGQPDGNAHPYVGLMVALDKDGVPQWRCSGSLAVCERIESASGIHVVIKRLISSDQSLPRRCRVRKLGPGRPEAWIRPDSSPSRACTLVLPLVSTLSLTVLDRAGPSRAISPRLIPRLAWPKRQTSRWIWQVGQPRPNQPHTGRSSPANDPAQRLREPSGTRRH
jgi:hypothetical protein